MLVTRKVEIAGASLLLYVLFEKQLQVMKSPVAYSL
jgi:hypothetical protein